MKEILEILGVFGVSIVIEKLPIKISPWTSVKKFFVGEVEEKVDKLSAEFDEHKATDKQKEIADIRYKLLTYYKSIYNGIPLSQYDMIYIDQLYDRYHNELKQNSYIADVHDEIKQYYKEQCRNEERK